MFFQTVPDDKILAFPLLNDLKPISGEIMLAKTKSFKINPLSKAQNKLLKDSLKRLLGNGLLEEQSAKNKEVKAMVLKNALNAIVLE